ncbi:hypothetical protein P167DRAFT_27092 [Morchella conica CCBAS932]|uniref:Uncharacterized protein n=1 Tax=Morchella conica CCBAS932 TaxID=1392247 RepID=A0A3N4KWM2_9PEZI|nr:hypothetical protein P167DRAFT_27092 [Morchella conica CCBAS932]
MRFLLLLLVLHSARIPCFFTFAVLSIIILCFKRLSSVYHFNKCRYLVALGYYFKYSLPL